VVVGEQQAQGLHASIRMEKLNANTVADLLKIALGATVKA
jgi:hypothetical protein